MIDYWATGYDLITMTGGFYTNCVWISWYTPQANEVYGQINHYLSGEYFTMIAGMDYDFTGNIRTGTDFSPTMTIATGGIHTGHIFDNNWGIAELSMNMPRCGFFEMSPSSPRIEGNTGTFICNGSSISGYIFRIFEAGSGMIYETTTSYTGTRIQTTWSALPEGNYTATCTILGAGGIPWASCPDIDFQVNSESTPPSSGTCDPNFQGEINFAPISSGSVVTNPTAGTYYSNSTGIVIQRAATEPNEFSIFGDFIQSVFTGIYTGDNIFNYAYWPFELTNADERNYIYGTFTTGDCTYTDSLKRVFVDTIPPTIPNIISPLNWAHICPSVALPVQRTASTDSGGISHYTYEMYNNNGMSTGLMLSGSFPGTATNSSLNLSYLPLGTYYLRIGAVDTMGHISYSPTVSFTTSQSYCSAGTGVMIVSPIISITNADLDTAYLSDPIYILGLTWPSLLTISNGMLFINENEEGVGTTGIVTSNDTIYIGLISSDEHNETVVSELNIMGITWTFSITTKGTDCNLSAAEKLLIQNIYEELKEEYNGNISRFVEFLNTFQSMVEDETNLSNSCALEYLLFLIEEDFDIDGIDTSNHIAPNCKEYEIAYDTTEQAYYSPDMMNRYYFINRESLIKHLDFYNPGDCHINTYINNSRSNDNDDPMKHVAPNGKIYKLIGQYGGYSAEEFISPKYFDSLQSIKTYIDLRNPAKTIWNHTIDTLFLPIVYAAPNGKEYKIYKTNRGFMSYKLMKVQYFTNLGELKNYIDRNNPSIR